MQITRGNAGGRIREIPDGERTAPCSAANTGLERWAHDLRAAVHGRRMPRESVRVADHKMEGVGVRAVTSPRD